MRIKIDENLPARLSGVLGQLGHDAETVAQEGLTGRPDDAVWEAAQSAGRFLMTQDIGFVSARAQARGAHHGVLLLRLRAPGRDALLERVTSLFESEPVESWKGRFVVASERKIRIWPAAGGG